MKKIIILLCAFVQLNAQLSPNQAAKFLDKNRVKARMHTVNNKFWAAFNVSNVGYEVPKGKGTHAQFCNSIWIGGLDNSGQLHIAANTYRQAGFDFFPGPLDTSNISSFSTSNSAVYNKLWKVDCNDIYNFVNAYNAGAATGGTYTVPSDIATYPARGVANFQKKMHPYVDANNNGIYNPAQEGDYPIIKGHQQILSIYNDYNGAHTETKGGLPMGLEIHERAYSYYDPTLPDSMKAVNMTTYYRYTIYNRSSFQYSNVFISDWSDVDLGNYIDDYIGTDSINHFTYCYNGDTLDENGFTLGYGKKPPVISHAILKTPCVDGIDNDQDGFVDEPGEQFILNRSMYYNNNLGPAIPPMVNPDSAIHYYRYMSGYWKDGTILTDGGTGYGGFFPAKYVYPGNPATNTGWTEGSALNLPGDRRVISSSGPINLPAGAKIEWGYAVVFSQDTTQDVNTITQFNSRVQRDVRNARYYDETHQSPQCAPAITLSLKETERRKLLAIIYPNPANERISIEMKGEYPKTDLKIIDLSGRTVKEEMNLESSDIEINISELEAGIYFVKIFNGTNSSTHKLIKGN